jgi:hypothetical protein
VNQRIPARVQLNLSAGRRGCRVAWRKLLSSSQECREKLRSEGLFKRKRIDDLKYLRRIAKSRRPLDLGKVARDLNPQAQVEPICHRTSAYQGWRVQKLHARRNRESRFPDLAGTVDRRRDRWHEIPWSRRSGSWENRESLHRGVAIREIPR